MLSAKLTNGNCYINHDLNLNCIITEWEGYSTSEELRLNHEAILLYLKAKKLNKILADTSNFLLIDRHDQEWLTNDWIPRAIQAGYKVCAIIEPRYHFNRIAIHNIINQVKDQLKVGFFKNKEQAKNWLKQQ